MVEAGEADHLVPERVWQELARGLAEPRPSRFVQVLEESGALGRVLPEIATLAHDGSLSLVRSRLEAAAAFSTPVRFAALTTGLSPEAVRRLCERVNAPGECRDLAELAARERAAAEGAAALAPEGLLALLERTDAFRRPERLERLLEVCESDLCARGLARRVPRERLEAARTAALEIDAATVAREHAGNIPAAIHAARAARIAERLGAR
jgi:tRNA nucleotidyltransferase (CCA-adding enzyme)